MDDKKIKKKAFASVFWKFSERMLAQMASLVVSIVLARILDPTDYSVVSVVTIFFTFANVFISGGLNTALIQKKEKDSTDYSTCLFISVVLAIAIYTVLFLCAPLIAKFYGQPILVIMIRVMGLSLPVNAVNSIWSAYISSNFLFRKFFFATLGGTLLSGVVGIVLAYCGFGAWALIAQQMTNIFVSTGILIISTRLYLVPRVSFERLIGLWNYGWKVFVSSIIGTVYTQITPLITGVKFSTADLSFYTRGKSFPELLSTTSTNTFSAVLLPVLSKYQDDKEVLLRYTRRFIQLTSYIAFPSMLGLFAVADKFVLVLLTEKWLPAVPFIRIFCVTYMFEMVALGNCETIKAMGRSDVFLIMEIVKKVGYFVAIVVFVFFSDSAETLASVYIVCTVIQVIVNSIPNKRLIGYKYSLQIKDLAPNLSLAIVMCVAVVLIGKITLNSTALLLVQILGGGAVYILLSAVTKNESFQYFLSMFLNIIKMGYVLEHHQEEKRVI